VKGVKAQQEMVGVLKGCLNIWAQTARLNNLILGVKSGSVKKVSIHLERPNRKKPKRTVRYRLHRKPSWKTPEVLYNLFRVCSLKGDTIILRKGEQSDRTKVGLRHGRLAVCREQWCCILWVNRPRSSWEKGVRSAGPTAGWTSRMVRVRSSRALQRDTVGGGRPNDDEGGESGETSGQSPGDKEQGCISLKNGQPQFDWPVSIY